MILWFAAKDDSFKALMTNEMCVSKPLQSVCTGPEEKQKKSVFLFVFHKKGLIIYY